MQQCNPILLFLGSGATAGSGIKKSGISLPTDQNFFDESNEDKKIIEKLKDAYPALKLCRENIATVKENSLYSTWNQLFIFRGLARANLCKDEDLTPKFEKLKEHNWLPEYRWRKEHYSHQFEIMKSGWPELYYLAELAIWDLRVLVKEIYHDFSVQNDAYKTLSDKLEKVLDNCIVINLNYDTTFDDFFDRRGFSCFKEKDKRCENLKEKIIRPHGSLKWTSKCRLSFNSKNWIQPWDEIFEDTNLKNQGYQRTSNPEELIFHQSLIVPPAEFKEEIIGNSSMPGLTSGILWNQWRHMEMAIKQAEKVIFYGTSLASGDDHLVFMINKYADGKKMEIIDKKKDEESRKDWENSWRERFPKAYIRYDYVE